MRLGKNTSQPANVRAKRVRCSLLSKMQAFLRSVSRFLDTLKGRSANMALRPLPVQLFSARYTVRYPWAVTSAACSTSSLQASDGQGRSPS